MKSFFYGLFSILLMLGSVPAFAQIGIGTKTPAASAALEVSSTTNNKGILIPRITATQKDAIASPAEGLLVYQTTAPIGFYYYTGGAWKLMAIQSDLAGKVDKVDGKNLSTNDYTTAEKTKLAAITGTNTGDQINITGNAATATKLAASKTINGVAFDGTANISIAAAASAEQLTGTTIKSTVTGSSLTSVGTLANLTVSNPIVGSITGNAATATSATTVTTNANLTGPVTSVGNATSITDGAITNVKITDVAATKITGTLPVANGGTGAATLTGLVKGNGTGSMTAAVAGTDYLTPTGSAAGLTNFPTFNQNTTGNAATATTASTVTTNANLTGQVTSVGNATTITDEAVTTAKVANANVTLAKLENLASGAIIVGNTSNRPTAVSISGDAVLSPTGALIITTGAITTSKIATGAVATASIADGAITNAKVTDVSASKITGTLPVANGGTGQTTYTDGQLLIGNSSGNILTKATLTAGAGISVTNGNGAITIASTNGLPSVNSAGDMLYWSGSAWEKVSVGANGQVLTLNNGLPTWSDVDITKSITNPVTGKVWMDRNLGASQVATSSTDALAYGDLYQWGRGTDGHQLRNSGVTATESITDTPGNNLFIASANIASGYTAYGDWRSSTNNSLWQGVGGTNNPCPSGYRIPTETEWNNEIATWTSRNSGGAFASPLKLTLGGERSWYDGSISNATTYGEYWSSTVYIDMNSNNGSKYVLIDTTNVYNYGSIRAFGFSVRCIKN